MSLMRRTVFRGALLGVIVILGAYAMISTVFKDDGTVSVGSKAPEFNLATLDDKVVALSDFRGKGVLLNFWASWCGPCEREMPRMNEAYAEGIENVEILAVNLMENRIRVNNFKEEYKLDFPILLDPYNDIGKKYNVVDIPATFLINEHGVVIEKVVGELRSKEQVISLLKKISAKSP